MNFACTKCGNIYSTGFMVPSDITEAGKLKLRNPNTNWCDTCSDNTKHLHVFQVYETNALLGYNQVAYLIKTRDMKYMCIALEGVDQSNNLLGGYELGISYDNLSDDEVKLSEFTIEQSPLFNALSELMMVFAI